MGQLKTVLAFGAAEYPDLGEDEDDWVTADLGDDIGKVHGVRYYIGESDPWHGYLVTDEDTEGPVDVDALRVDPHGPVAVCQAAWTDLRDVMGKRGVELPKGCLLLVHDYECA